MGGQQRPEGGEREGEREREREREFESWWWSSLVG